MKQKVTPAVWAVAALVVALVLGFIGWKSLGSSSTEMDPATIAAHQAAKNAKNKSH